MRRPDGAIHTEAHSIDGDPARAHRGPFRGLLALKESVAIGTRALQIALRETTNVQLTTQQIRSTLAAAGVGALVLFVVLPGIAAAAWRGPVVDVLEAVMRGLVLVVYLLIVSRSSSASRLFAYHGAEHKVVAAVERTGAVPAPDAARRASPIHPRCGTNFITLFVVVSGVVHAFLPRDPLWQGAVWRVLAVPLDAVLAYELMRAAARGAGAVWARIVTWPGRALQRITTSEPSDEQLDVAIAALHALVE